MLCDPAHETSAIRDLDALAQQVAAVAEAAARAERHVALLRDEAAPPAQPGPLETERYARAAQQFLKLHAAAQLVARASDYDPQLVDEHAAFEAEVALERRVAEQTAAADALAAAVSAAHGPLERFGADAAAARAVVDAHEPALDAAHREQARARDAADAARNVAGAQSLSRDAAARVAALESDLQRAQRARDDADARRRRLADELALAQRRLSDELEPAAQSAAERLAELRLAAAGRCRLAERALPPLNTALAQLQSALGIERLVFDPNGDRATLTVRVRGQSVNVEVDLADLSAGPRLRVPQAPHLNASLGVSADGLLPRSLSEQLQLALYSTLDALSRSPAASLS